ncbi:MAG: polysaccharide biosynthesis tyrosine autokinase [Muribaculaceae bacterium]|nr:polysaccharide biosynthesis tyrosine autokinase [Muribaculaceae bacterium]
MAEVVSKKKKTAESSNSVPLIDIVYMTLHHWPWILLSVFICVGAAYFYLLRTSTIYSRSAEIQIKDDSKGGNAGDAQGMVDLGIFTTNTNVQNEILNLRSKDVTEEIVRRLNLDVNYTHNGRFRNPAVYGTDLPVKISVANFPTDESYSLTLDIAGDGKVKISDISRNGQEETSQTFSGAVGDSIGTPLGKIVVNPTDYYRKGEAVELMISKMPLRTARDIYNARLSVTMSDEKSSVIRMMISDESIQRADDFLNALIGVYNENWLRDKNQIAVSTSNFIKDRLVMIENELGNVDSDISSYKSANLVPDVDAAASIYMSQSQQTQQQIFELNNRLQMTRYIRSYLANGNAESLLPANSGVENVNIESLINEYNQKLLQRNNLVAKSSEENPLVVQLDEQLGAQRQAIIHTVDNEITNLNTQIRSLRGNEAQLMSRIAANPNQAKNLLSVERQQKVKESLYLFLLQKREENELSQAFTAYNTRIVNRPGASGVPNTPNRRNILAVAFLIGLAIPFGFSYIKEMNNTKVRGREDIKDLAAPLLGEIPQYTGGAKGTKNYEANEILVKPKSRNIINEAFRVLRTNTEFSRVNKDGCNVFALTSFNPGSGKSFITMNLATAIAIKGKRVLVIDGDMRHGSSSAYMPKIDCGLSDYLGGEVDDINSILVSPEGIPTLQVITIGSVPPNPAELLESARFGQLIEQMRHYYDYILIDCPPIEVVADAQIIDQFADRTIFVIRAGLLDRDMLPELDRLYEEKKYHHMAVILNGTRNDQGRYGYSHSYKYGYGYGYGYGYNYVSKK